MLPNGGPVRTSSGDCKFIVDVVALQISVSDSLFWDFGILFFLW
jgi:hypothetical protein